MRGFQNRVCLYPKKWNHLGFVNISPTDSYISKAERTPSPRDMNRQECRTKRIDSMCEVSWIPLCARDGSVIKWGRGEGEALSIHVMWTQCALGLIDTSMERSSRVLHHGNQKIWFFVQKKFEIEFHLYFDLCWTAEIIQVGLNICRHGGCIVVPSRVDI